MVATCKIRSTLTLLVSSLVCSLGLVMAAAPPGARAALPVAGSPCAKGHSWRSSAPISTRS